MKSRIILAGVLAFVFCPLAWSEGAASLAPTSNRLILQKWTAYHLSQKQYVEAETRIRAQMEHYPRDPVLWTLLGDAYGAAGDSKQALKCYAFARQVAQGLDQSEVEYSIARYQAQTGDRTGAESTLKRMASDPTLADTSSLAIEKLKAGRSFPTFDRSKIEALRLAANQRTWSMVSTLTTGFDSNTALTPDQTGAAASAKGSGFLTPSVQANYSSEDLRASILAGYTKNIETAAQSSNNVPMSVGGEWRLPGAWSRQQELSLASDFAIVYSNATSKMALYSQTLTVALKKGLSWRDNKFSVVVPVEIAKYPGVETTSSDQRDGTGVGVTLESSHAASGWTFNEFGSYFKTMANGDEQKQARSGLGISASFSPWEQMDLMGSASYSSTDYFVSSTGRKDSMLNFAIQLSRRFSDSLSGGVVLSNTQNRSNVSDMEYSKNVISLKVSHVY